MKFHGLKLAVAATVGLAFTAGAVVADTPKSGGTLNIVVGSKIPSYDGHIESTFGMIHPIRPFYSTLIRVNPDNPYFRQDSCFPIGCTLPRTSQALHSQLC